MLSIFMYRWIGRAYSVDDPYHWFSFRLETISDSLENARTQLKQFEDLSQIDVPHNLVASFHPEGVKIPLFDYLDSVEPDIVPIRLSSLHVIS
jgi:hypothetical protein